MSSTAPVAYASGWLATTLSGSAWDTSSCTHAPAGASMRRRSSTPEALPRVSTLHARRSTRRAWHGQESAACQIAGVLRRPPEPVCALPTQVRQVDLRQATATTAVRCSRVPLLDGRSSEAHSHGQRSVAARLGVALCIQEAVPLPRRFVEDVALAQRGDQPPAGSLACGRTAMWSSFIELRSSTGRSGNFAAHTAELGWATEVRPVSSHSVSPISGPAASPPSAPSSSKMPAAATCAKPTRPLGVQSHHAYSRAAAGRGWHALMRRGMATSSMSRAAVAGGSSRRSSTCSGVWSHS